MGGVKFVLIHGAPAGPATWRWVDEVLTSAGHEVVVPDLRRAAMSGQPAAAVREAVAACSTDTDVVAGHSGAGDPDWNAELEALAGSALDVARSARRHRPRVRSRQRQPRVASDPAGVASTRTPRWAQP
jgi:pimeloyl-ACP methyl ester carboxylesterase